LAFVRAFPIGSPVYGDFSAPAQVAILVGQIVVPSLGARCSVSRSADGSCSC